MIGLHRLLQWTIQLVLIVIYYLSSLLSTIMVTTRFIPIFDAVVIDLN